MANTFSDVASLSLRVFEDSRERRRNGRPSSIAPQAGASERAVTLPAPVSSSKPIATVLAERKATRAYSEQAIPLEAIATMLSSSAGADSVDWPEEHAVAPLEFLLVAWNVETLEAGVYAYQSDSHVMSRLGDAPDRTTEGATLVLQPEFASAAAIVFIAGALGAATEAFGHWGHQNLLVRAGAAGHRLWLASLACGLVGTVFAGFLPRAAQQLAGVDGYRRAGLFAYATGAPKAAFRSVA